MSYDWLIELLAGMILGIYCTSPKVRAVVNHYIFRRRQSYIEQVEEVEQSLQDGEITAENFAAYIAAHPELEIRGKKK